MLISLRIGERWLTTFRPTSTREPSQSPIGGRLTPRSEAARRSRGQEHPIVSPVESPHNRKGGAKMGQWLSNLAPWEIYLIAAPSIMLGAILLLGGIILLLESPKRGRG
jgi:hypothetical protein